MCSIVVGQLSRAVRIPEQLDASTVAGVATVAQTSKRKGKSNKKSSEDDPFPPPPRKKSKKVGEVKPIVEVVEPPRTREVIPEAQVRLESVGQSSSEAVAGPGESRPETPSLSGSSVLAGDGVGPVLVATRTPQPVGPLEVLH